MDKVSIIIPVFNCENYLQRLLDSFLHQTYREFQLILVDDGSTDKSGSICEEYAELDERITVIHQENGGSSKARNRGLQEAEAEYIIFADGDDFVEEFYVEKLMEHNACDFVTAGYWIQKPDLGWFEMEISDKEINVVAIKQHPESYLNTKLFSTVWAKLYKRSIIVQNRLEFDAAVFCAEDTVFNFQYLNCISSVAMVPNCGYHYCYYSFSISRTGHEKYGSNRIRMEQLIWEFYDKGSAEAKQLLDTRRYKILVHLLLYYNAKNDKKNMLLIYRHPFFQSVIAWKRKEGSISERVGHFFLDFGICTGFQWVVWLNARLRRWRWIFWTKHM